MDAATKLAGDVAAVVCRVALESWTARPYLGPGERFTTAEMVERTLEATRDRFVQLHGDEAAEQLIDPRVRDLAVAIVGFLSAYESEPPFAPVVSR